MDPKMDSGCVPAEELADNGQQITRCLLPSEVLGIIDQLLCLEVRIWGQFHHCCVIRDFDSD